MVSAKDLIDSMTRGFVARGHSLTFGRNGISIGYAAKRFRVLAEPMLAPYAIRVVEEAEKSGNIREILGTKTSVAPMRGIRLFGDTSIPIDDKTRIYLPSWLKDRGKCAEFVTRILGLGINTLILGEKGEGHPKQETETAPFFEWVKQYGIRIVLRPLIASGMCRQVPGTLLWVESRFDSPGYLDGKEDLTLKEVILREIGEWRKGGELIFSPPEGDWGLLDGAQEGVMLAPSQLVFESLRKRLTPCYTPLVVPLHLLERVKGHAVGLVHSSLEEWTFERSSLLFREN